MRDGNVKRSAAVCSKLTFGYSWTEVILKFTMLKPEGGWFPAGKGCWFNLMKHFNPVLSGIKDAFLSLV